MTSLVPLKDILRGTRIEPCEEHRTHSYAYTSIEYKAVLILVIHLIHGHEHSARINRAHIRRRVRVNARGALRDLPMSLTHFRINPDNFEFDPRVYQRARS